MHCVEQKMIHNKKCYLKRTRRKLMTNYIQLQAIDEQSNISNMQILTGVEVNSEAKWSMTKSVILIS